MPEQTDPKNPSKYWAIMTEPERRAWLQWDKTQDELVKAEQGVTALLPDTAAARHAWMKLDQMPYALMSDFASLMQERLRRLLPQYSDLLDAVFDVERLCNEQPHSGDWGRLAVPGGKELPPGP